MDKSGNLLFGTRTNGLFVFSTKDDTYNHITTKSGLAGNWVKSISVDERNNIYAATNKGVDMIRVINQEPAIRKLQLSQSSLNAPVNFVLAANDSVWIGTDSGLITYMPLKDIVDSTPPHIYLIQLSINGKNDSTFIPYARSLENYTLPHNRNIIALRFSGAYLQAGNVKYTYRLKGQDDNWSEPDTRNFVSYNLPPGKYDFEVHAISSSGVRSVYPSSLSITILAPFYKTIWFLIACITIAMWLIYMLYRYRIAQVTKLENMRSRISADLHDDLGSGLSRIKFLSETMKLNNNRDASLEKNLNKISLYADEMADKIGEIVWALNNKNDKLADLIAYMRSYAMEYLTNHGISCTADTPAAIPELIIDGETRRNIFLAMKEILFNIVKHARADRVDFKITIQKSFQLIIHDNGIGIDLQNVRKLGNGLSNISERMRHSRGSAAISNENGTKIILNVPLLHT